MNQLRERALRLTNSFHMTDRLFLECCRLIAREFPVVQYEAMLVDASTAHWVRTPGRFDVVVATNFYGDILSDLANELSGSLSLAGSMVTLSLPVMGTAFGSITYLQHDEF